MRCRLAAAIAIFALLWLPTVTPPPAARAASACTGWSNTLVPPPTIRVLRTATSKVETVDFKTYVKWVMAWEWPYTWTAETLKAGAVAVKEYGWYYTMHYRGGTATGGCYDVRDSTADQLYRAPDATHPLAQSLVNAVDLSWGYSVTKNGAQFLTGYRSYQGDNVPCGSDADGSHLFQHSAQDCGVHGKTMAQILATYYYPGLEVIAPLTLPIASFLSAPPDRQVTARSSAKLGWSEESPTGGTIVSRSATLLMAKAFGGRCGDRWMAPEPPWTETSPPPHTVTNLANGYCYRVVVRLVDDDGLAASSGSGPMLVDSGAPVATFTSPKPDTTTAAGSSVTVSWTETPAAGRTITGRTLVAEYASAPAAASCAGARWRTLWTRTGASPETASGLGRLVCYRFRVTLTDSAGHQGTWMSGAFLTPASF